VRRQEEVSIGLVADDRIGGERPAAQFAMRTEPGHGVLAIRPGPEARVGLKAVRRPFPDRIPPTDQVRLSRALPLCRAGQATTNPTTPGFRFPGTQVHD